MITIDHSITLHKWVLKNENKLYNCRFNSINSPARKRRKSEIHSEVINRQLSENLATSIFNTILEDWMHNFGKDLKKCDYDLLLDSITNLISRNLPLTFFIPGFPCKSSNTNKKVLGDRSDFSEFMAIRSLITTIRKLEAIYPHGVRMVILSDYHTFDQYIGVKEDSYNVYHDELKQIISDVGGTDVIELISLSSFPEFSSIDQKEISTKLREEYGGRQVLDTFDDAIKKDSCMLEKYKQLKKFMQADQSHNLPGSPRATSTRNLIKKITRGMMAQGVALDNFLKRQTMLKDYVRLSIHHHLPSSGKFAINLFKGIANDGGILRTPWHHVVLFDSLTGEFIIDHKVNITENTVSNSCLVTVRYQDKPWFLLRLHFNKEALSACKTIPQFEVTMARGSCGMTIQCISEQSSSIKPEASLLDERCLTSLIKEFGLVVLRGFKKFDHEADIVNFYKGRAKQGILEWKFGPVHKVSPNEDMPGYVNSYEGIPIHFDLVVPPKYMAISQKEHKYSDFICREFLLYCKTMRSKTDDGSTTFVDARGVVLALAGSEINKWKETTLMYETKLKNKSDKELYFGGEKNTYEYPLIMQCPWTGHNVVRWLQTWTEREHPTSNQHNWTVIQPSRNGTTKSVEALEEDIRRVALDKRFFFAHSYEEGDQVYVNNYTTLHGRNGFTNSRELWRLQAIPESNNLPEYFLKNKIQNST